MKEVLRLGFLLFFSIPFCSEISAQATNVNQRTTQIVDRLIATYDISSNIHGVLKPYKRDDVVKYINKLYQSDQKLDKRDLKDIAYIFADNNDIFIPEESGQENRSKVYIDSTEVFYTYNATDDDPKVEIFKKRNPVFKYFFKSQANFLEINHEDFRLRINPIINIKFGTDIQESTGLIFQNTRGLEIKGLIDDKICFYINLIENQGTFNNYIVDRINAYKAIPGHGSYKPFTSRLSDQIEGFDFPNSQAYFGLNISKNVGMELGHGRHFIGNGFRSLLLSDYAHNYFYLKLSTKVWKFHYQNIFAELAPISSQLISGDVLLPKKYMANHFLNFKASDNFDIGIFESVIYSRPDHFEFQYLNPIIFYRSVEFSLNSPDNVILGLNLNWRPFKKTNLYGQMILDEFKLSRLNSGSWANKHGFQFGAKYFDLFDVEDLSVQVEYNIVRPYTYDHRDTISGFNISVANYSHFNQPLAHPLGANFKELIFLINYKPIDKLTITNQLMMTRYGEDTDDQNWGGDILKPYQIGTILLVPKQLDNFIGQGTKTEIFQWKVDLSYEFFHNYYLELNYLHRLKNSADDAFDINTNYLGAGIRANISNYKMDY